MNSSGRWLIAGLLLLSPFWGSAFSFQPQANITVTSFSTVTTSITATSYSYYPLSTIVSTTTASDALASDDFSLPPPPGKYCGMNIYYKLTLQQGQHLIGSLQSNTTVTFLVLSLAQYVATHKYCETIGSVSLLKSVGTSYEFDFVPPKDDDYYFFIFNESSFTASGHLELAAITSSTVTSTVFSTMAQPYATPFTQTISTAYTQGIPESPSVSMNLLLIGVVIVAIVLVAFFLLRTRSKQKGVGAKVRLCASCGAQLAPNAKFCKKCGKPISKA